MNENGYVPKKVYEHYNLNFISFLHIKNITILLILFQLKNVKTIFSLQAIQKQPVGGNVLTPAIQEVL